jgi:hypothetical protein
MGIIYKIEVAGEIYIGSTTQKISQRQGCHNYNLRNPHNKHYNYLLYRFCRENNIKNIKCKLIEEVDNDNIKIKEQEQIDLLNPILNSQKAFRTEEQLIEQKKECNNKKSNCPICNKELLKNNIHRHIRNIH